MQFENQDLGYRKVCASRVPKILTEVHKVNHMESSQKFFDLFNREGRVLGLDRDRRRNLGAPLHTRVA